MARPLPRLVRWVIVNPLAALTISGLIFYGFVRLAYGIFYNSLGVSPEDVGLGYQEILAQSALMFLVILLVGSLALLAYGVAYFFFVVLYVSTLMRFASKRRTTDDSVLSELRARMVLATGWKRRWLSFLYQNRSFLVRSRRPQAIWVLRKRWPLLFASSFTVTAVIGMAILIGKAGQLADEVKHGQAIRTETIFGIPFLGFSARRVSFVLANNEIHNLGLTGQDCVLYLGESSGVGWFFVYNSKLDSGRTMRVPTNEFILTTASSDVCGSP